jgi:hypothetical protein
LPCFGCFQVEVTVLLGSTMFFELLCRFSKSDSSKNLAFLFSSFKVVLAITELINVVFHERKIIFQVYFMFNNKTTTVLDVL